MKEGIGFDVIRGFIHGDFLQNAWSGKSIPRALSSVLVYLGGSSTLVFEPSETSEILPFVKASLNCKNLTVKKRKIVLSSMNSNS
jgi:hypothetical protein